jgi:hypothetical protein
MPPRKEKQAHSPSREEVIDELSHVSKRTAQLKEVIAKNESKESTSQAQVVLDLYERERDNNKKTMAEKLLEERQRAAIEKKQVDDRLVWLRANALSRMSE